jgi:hypothetical protein
MVFVYEIDGSVDDCSIDRYSRAPPKLPGPHKEAAMEAALADFMADWSPN